MDLRSAPRIADRGPRAAREFAPLQLLVAWLLAPPCRGSVPTQDWRAAARLFASVPVVPKLRPHACRRYSSSLGQPRALLARPARDSDVRPTPASHPASPRAKRSPQGVLWPSRNL